MNDAEIFRGLLAAGLPCCDAVSALDHWRNQATRSGSDAVRVQTVIDSLSR